MPVTRSRERLSLGQGNANPPNEGRFLQRTNRFDRPVVQTADRAGTKKEGCRKGTFPLGQPFLYAHCGQSSQPISRGTRTRAGLESPDVPAAFCAEAAAEAIALALDSAAEGKTEVGLAPVAV